jgi:predicted secreted protein
MLICVGRLPSARCKGDTMKNIITSTITTLIIIGIFMIIKSLREIKKHID